MGYEIAEAFPDRLPDVLVYPTGGGTGIIGIWKAFGELRAAGWFGDATMPALPRMVCVQADGCAPIVRAFEAGAPSAEPWPNARTVAAGLRVPRALGDREILDVLRASRGAAIAVSDAEVLECTRRAGRLIPFMARLEHGKDLRGWTKLRYKLWRSLVPHGSIEPTEWVRALDRP